MTTKALMVAMGMLLALPGSAVAKCEGVAPNPPDRIVLVGDVLIERGERVENAVAVDGNVLVNGEVCEDVIVFGGRTRINGAVAGDVVSFAGDPIVLGRRARVDGDVVYLEGEGERPVVPATARVGGEVKQFDGTEIGDEIWNSLLVVGILLLVGVALSSLVLGFFLLWLAPRAADSVMRPATEAIGASIGMGLAVAIGLPVFGLLVLFTVIGIPLGVFLLLLLLPLYVLGGLVSSWVLGRLILREPRSRYLSFLIGWAILTAASLIPFLGTLVGIAATVYGLGVLTVALWRARNDDRPSGGDGITHPTQPVFPAPAPHTPLPPPPGA